MKTFVHGIVVLGLVASAIGFAHDGLGTGLGWDVTITYTTDASTGDVSYDSEGLYSQTIECSGDWQEQSASASSTPDPDEVLAMSWSYDRAEFRVMRQASQTVTTTVYECQDHELRLVPAVKDWISRTATSFGISSCNVNAAGQRTAAPGTLHFEVPIPVDDGTQGACITAEGKGALVTGVGPIPFTGYSYAKFSGDPQSDYVDTRTCNMIGGVCWQGGGGDTDHIRMECDKPFWDPSPCFWKISCSVFSVSIIGNTGLGPIGDWGCSGKTRK